MSILRTIATNPAVAKQLPKYTPPPATGLTDKMGVLMSADDPAAKLVANAAEWLLKHKSELKAPTGEPMPLYQPPATLTLPPRDGYRSMVVPRAVDSDENVREVRVAASNEHVTKEDIEAMMRVPLEPLPLGKFVSDEREENAFCHEGLPFELAKHPSARAHVAVDMLSRLGTDMAMYARALKQQKELKLKSPSPAALHEALASLHDTDASHVESGMAHVLNLANGRQEAIDEPGSNRLLMHLLGVAGGVEPRVDFELLVALVMSGNAVETLRRLNPLLGEPDAVAVLQLTAVLMLRVNRMSQVMRCRPEVDKLRRSLARLEAGSSADSATRIALQTTLDVQASKLAGMLGARRHYAEVEGDLVRFDPRYLVFEFTSRFLLRSQQVELINAFMYGQPEHGLLGARDGVSSCHQMIMGMLRPIQARDV